MILSLYQDIIRITDTPQNCKEEVTFVTWTADELNAVELVDATRLQDGEVL